MATIALYAGTINQMPGLIREAKRSVSSFKDELQDVYRKALAVDSSVCDMTEVIDSLRSSTQTQEERITKLEEFQIKSEEFINDTVRIDNKAAATVNQNKDDFYKKYSYLKPDCEKSGWEKFCEGLAKVGEWCKEHWKLIVTIVLVIAAVVVVVLSGGTALAALGPFATILEGMANGLLIGAAMGGLMGGFSSVAAGGSFFEGFENGAFSGALSGALMGGAMAGLGTLGATLGKGVSCLSHLGKAIKVTANVTKALSMIMGGFDTLSMMDGMFGIFGGNLASFNAKLHESRLYNIFQFGVSALAAFTGGMTSTMSCFVAGTLILTANGLVAIESIKVGDKVISTNPETGVTEEKTVLETFSRTVTELVHLTIDGEVITTTHNHPFYVVGKGFVNAGKLKISDMLMDNYQHKYGINNISFESSDNPTRVYNFMVEDNHTYYVGNKSIFVHNADCRLILNSDGSYDVEMQYKEDWTPEQRAEADAKCKILSEADTRKTDVTGKRNPYNTSKYRKDYSVPATQDVDHMIDLQLGGVDNTNNMWGLDSSVNRSLGSQINTLIKNLPDGTKFKNFVMKF